MEKRGPWTVKESISKYKNPWMEVREDQVLRPDGKPGIYGVVTIQAGVSVLALDNEGFVYLTNEFHYAVGEETIEVVSGGIEKGETALSAAKRELEEELGIQAKEWTKLGVVNPFTSHVYSPATLFLAQELSFPTPKNESTEIIKLVKVKLSDAVQMVMQSKITHGPSCTLLLKVHQYLSNKEKSE